MKTEPKSFEEAYIDLFEKNYWNVKTVIFEKFVSEKPYPDTNTSFYSEVEKKSIDVYLWQNRSDDSSPSFTRMLLSLFSKADSGNKLRLMNAFPETYIAYLIWYYYGLTSVKV